MGKIVFFVEVLCAILCICIGVLIFAGGGDNVHSVLFGCMGFVMLVMALTSFLNGALK